MAWQLPERPKGPWYRNWEYWTERGMRYLWAERRLPQDAPARAELRQMDRFSFYRLVFESNAIEKAGRPLGETQKIIDEYFPVLPSTYAAAARIQDDPVGVLRQVDWPTILRAASEERGVSLEDLRLTVSMGEKSRGYIEVMQHACALRLAELRMQQWAQVLYLQFIIRSGVELPSAYGERDPLAVLSDAWKELGEEVDEPVSSIPRLLTEEWLRQCHQTLAEDLLDPDAGVPAGEYRRDSRHADGHVFPAPELVPSSMARFVRASGAVTIVDVWDCPFETAARLSYEFVRIHPFPDFNGRVSRIILTMVLRAARLPFHLTLRSNGKGLARYATALKHANGGNLRAYETLIAMRTVETFEEVDAHLADADLPSLLTYAPDDLPSLSAVAPDHPSDASDETAGNETDYLYDEDDDEFLADED